MTVFNLFWCWAWLCPYCTYTELGRCKDSPNGEGWEPVFTHLEADHSVEHRRDQLNKVPPNSWQPYLWKDSWLGPGGYWR